jgi:hypothetical protein
VVQTHNVVCEQQADLDAEEPERKMAADLVTHGRDSAISKPGDNSRSMTTAARAVHSSTPNVATTARDAVFSTPEMLEAIISFLPSHDILSKAQRVSRTWKTIVQSPTIQTKLWLKYPANRVVSPADHSVHFPIGFYLHESSNINAVLAKNQPVYCDSLTPNNIYFVRPIVHGLYYGYRTLGKRQCVVNGRAYFNEMLINVDHLNQTLDTVQHTWLDMYLTEPAITVVQLRVAKPIPRVRTIEPSHAHVSQVSIRDPGGLTFGRVVEVLDKIFASASNLIPNRLEARVTMSFVTKS